MTQLTAGSCYGLHNAAPEDTSLFEASHILQVLSVKSVNSPNSNVDRYRIIVSDGEHFIQAMLATQLNSLVKEGNIKKNTIVNVTKMTCNFVQDKRLLIILEFEAVEQANNKIGNPITLTPEQSKEAADTPTASTSVQQTPAPKPSAPVSAPVQQKQVSAPHGNRGSIFPIEGLSPYQNNWTIKARVTQKSDLRKYANAKGDGQLFNVTLMDETGEIRGTAFNAVAVELYDKFQEGKVYYVSRARVNIAKKQFSHLSNEYELGFDNKTEIEECFDTTNLPVVKYNFIQLSKLDELVKDSTCDVLAVIKNVGPTEEITSKATSRKVSKRDLTIVDMSGFSVRMTLWGKQAEEFNSPEAVIAFKSVKVGDFGGRTLSVFSSSTMAINPDIQEAHMLKGWYEESGKTTDYQAHANTGGGGGGTGGTGFQRSQIRSLRDVKDSQVGYPDSGQNEFFSTRATIVFMKPDSLWYTACVHCNKKVNDGSNGWHCEKCNKTEPVPKYRFIMSMACSDWSDQAWLQGFNEVGELVFGMTADKLHDIKEQDEGEFASIVQQATCETYNFLCRARTDDYNGQQRVRYGISRIAPLNYKEEAHALLENLRSPWGQTAV
ncbi:Replication protein A subunit [Mycena sanguinolenta]|uniref:Replication protein A subunit n=1 Tax=Mycena sanguinolenta TaxID=230812 RepID=A0A8H7D8W4_9AGAR|nr:Replication protein A subunit [Mycena sanguinolenta]